MPRPISASISLPSLSHNLAMVAQQLNSVSHQNQCSFPKIWAVIKADAYGHGIVNAVRAFDRADGLALLDLNEAVLCRQAGWTKPILLLEGFFEPADIEILNHYSLSITLHSQEQLQMLLATKPASPVNAFVKLNSGMNRLGFSPRHYRAAYQQALAAQQQGVLGLLGKMTHFARADDDAVVTIEQINVFNKATEGLPGPISMCNSAATLTPARWLSALPDQEQWMRPGICLYGSSPFNDRTAFDLQLRPAMTLHSQLISARTIERGDGVGYGHAFIAPGTMRVGVVACGYADGYPRHAPTGTPITVAGMPSRLLGRVSMDMLMVDLTSIPQAQIGSPVVLWGEGGPSVDSVAQAAQTIGYELLCALAPRVPKNVV